MILSQLKTTEIVSLLKDLIQTFNSCLAVLVQMKNMLTAQSSLCYHN